MSCFCAKNSQILFFFVKILSDRITISLRFFLEKRAILLIFAYKDESSTDPSVRPKDFYGLAWVLLA